MFSQKYKIKERRLNPKKILISFCLLFIFLQMININYIEQNIKARPYSDINKRKVHKGKHKVTDKVGNIYYWTNNNDLGNPATGGYGDMKTYYKNGHTWQFTFNNKQVEDTVQFPVTNKKYNNVPANNVIFCIEPLKRAEWITGTDKSKNHYSKLSKAVQKEVDLSVSYGLKLFDATGNFNYLAAAQMSTWKAVGAINIKMPASLLKEYNEIEKYKSDFKKNISFNNQTIILNYNEKTKLYEAEINDLNNVFDNRYKNELKNKYNNYNINYANNKLKITRENKKINNDEKNEVINLNYQTLPLKAKIIVGIHFEVNPIFVNSNQDLVSGLGANLSEKFSLNIKEAKGTAYLYKYGMSPINKSIEEKEKIKKDNEDEKEDNKSKLKNNIDEDDLNNENENNTEDENNGDKLEGVSFEVYKDNDNGEINNENLVETIKSDKEGKVSTSSLPLGKYLLKEKEEIIGYVKEDKVYPFEITKDNEIVKINNGKLINYEKTGKIKINKIDSKTKVGLEGVEFTIFKSSNNEIYQKGKTDKNGILLFNNIEYGEYTLKETKPINKYYENDNEYPFQINKDNVDQTFEFEIENIKIIEGKLWVTGQSGPIVTLITLTLILIIGGYYFYNKFLIKRFY